MNDAPARNAFQIATRIVEMTPGVRIVSRQQIKEPSFYQKVRAGLLDGSVSVVDQRADYLKIQGRDVKLTEAAALKALADSQDSWVGKPVSEQSPLESLRNAS